MKRVAAIFVCLVLAIALSACRNADFVGNSYRVGNNVIVEFQTLNTTKSQEIDLRSGDTVRFDVTREAGQIAATFGIKGASPDYEGKKLETGSFTVCVNEDGRYVLSISGSDAKGCIKMTKIENQ